jgi:hypothetical protein
MGDLTDREVRRLISREYGQEIRACRELLDYAVAELQSWSGRPIKRGAGRIIVAEAARGTKTLDAVLHLCEGGYGEQATMLNRSLFEGMAIAHWVSDDRREAVGLFTRHATYSALLWEGRFDALGWLDGARRRSEPCGSLRAPDSGLGAACVRALPPAHRNRNRSLGSQLNP